MRARADITIVLADLPGVARDVLAMLLSESPDLRLVAQASTRDQLDTVLDAMHPDVVVLDDRLLRTGDWSPPDGVRLVVVGVDDDPAYAARARCDRALSSSSPGLRHGTPSRFTQRG